MALANQQSAVAKDEAGDDVDRPSVDRFHRDFEPTRFTTKAKLLARLEGFEPPTLRSEVSAAPQSQKTVGKTRGFFALRGMASCLLLSPIPSHSGHKKWA